MKKLLLMAVLFMTAGCVSIMPMESSRIAENIHIGMTLKDFLSFAGKDAALETLTSDASVYSLEFAGLVPGAGYTTAGKKLFLFNTEGKLVKMESEDFRKYYRRSEEKEE